LTRCRIGDTSNAPAGDDPRQGNIGTRADAGRLHLRTQGMQPSDHQSLYRRILPVAFRHWDSRIQLSRLQVSVIARAIAARGHRANMLIYGCGFDSPLWTVLNAAGTTTFVEQDAAWAKAVRSRLPGAKVFEYSFSATTVARTSATIDPESLASVPVPEFVTACRWDIVLVDGPAGHKPDRPGRALPLYWTHRFSDPMCDVFVDDFERPLEHLYARTFFQSGTQVTTELEGTDPSRRMLWRVGQPEEP
jgi:hypothetical protein